jgi:hypothetical protein
MKLLARLRASVWDLIQREGDEPDFCRLGEAKEGGTHEI